MVMRFNINFSCALLIINRIKEIAFLKPETWVYAFSNRCQWDFEFNLAFPLNLPASTLSAASWLPRSLESPFAVPGGFWEHRSCDVSVEPPV